MTTPYNKWNQERDYIFDTFDKLLEWQEDAQKQLDILNYEVFLKDKDARVYSTYQKMKEYFISNPNVEIMAATLKNIFGESKYKHSLNNLIDESVVERIGYGKYMHRVNKDEDNRDTEE